jgi:4-amino-4-deoxy-L-arabinose transferase-like glycosyltransferase
MTEACSHSEGKIITGPPLPLERYGVAIILVTAAIMRLSVFVGFTTLPFYHNYRLDALYYHEAGLRWASGDWLLGQGVLSMSPLYSLFVGFLYRIFGHHPAVVPLAQICLSVLTVWLIMDMADRLWNRRLALLAGGIASFYGPLAFYPCLTIATTLATYLSTMTLRQAIIAIQSEPSARKWFWVGVALGLSSITRPNALILAPVLFGFALFGNRKPISWRTFFPVIILTLTTTVVIAPVTLRNFIVTGEPVLITSSGGLNFYLGNGKDAHGTFRIPPSMPQATHANAQFYIFRAVAEKTMGRKLSSREVSRFWYTQTWSEISEDPMNWLWLLLRKVQLFWSAHELANTHDYGFHRQINPAFAIPWLAFGLLGPFAMLGLYGFLRRGTPAERSVATISLAWMVAVVSFFVIAHYRLPAVPGLILAAVAGLRIAVSAMRSRSITRIAGVALWLGIGGVLALAPTFAPNHDEEYFKMGYAWHVLGHLEKAKQAYFQALALNPEHISAHKNLARLYMTHGERHLAILHWRRILELANKKGLLERVHEATVNLQQLIVTSGHRIPASRPGIR